MWWRLILALLFFLLYARSPIDLIPDFFRPIGFIDDLLVFGALWWWLKKQRRKLTATRQDETEENKSDNRNNERAHNQSREKQKTPHEILGVALSASKEEIDEAYKALMKQYHPDRVHGLGEELQEVARRKAQEINAAYDTLRKR